MLNLSNMISKFRNFAIFVIVYLYVIFHTWFVGNFMIWLHTVFNISSLKGSCLNLHKFNAEAMLPFYVLQTN